MHTPSHYFLETILLLLLLLLLFVTLQTVWGMSAWMNCNGDMDLEVQMTVWGTNSTEGAAHVIVKHKHKHQNIEPNEQDSS